MGYVETLFGHQDSILALDSLRGDSCVSVGGRDKTARYWKIVEETQLVFRGGGRSRIREVLEGGLGADDDPGHRGQSVKGKERESHNFVEGSLECIAMIDETTFVTGGDSGYISLYHSSLLFSPLIKLRLDQSRCGQHRRKSRYLSIHLHMASTRCCLLPKALYRHHDGSRHLLHYATLISSYQVGPYLYIYTLLASFHKRFMGRSTPTMEAR